jgi:hypothetical protein
MRGRKPSGPALVEHLPASPVAKQRLRVILQTMAGTCSITQACAQLHVSPARLAQLRTVALQAGLDRLEPQPLGRRPRQQPAVEVLTLQSQVGQLQTELQAAQVREEIALVLPAVHLTEAGPEKKAPRRRSPTSARRR